MNRLICFLVACLLASGCQNQSPGKAKEELSGEVIKNPNTLSESDEEKLPEITFETKEHNFGKMTEGDKVEYEFRFTNTGEAPLIISDVRATCGCTTPNWPRGVIKAGESNVIKVVYDSQGHPGEFNKGITVIANTYPNQTLLKVSGVVFKK